MLIFSPLLHAAPNNGVEGLRSAAGQGEKLWGPNATRKVYFSLNECLDQALKHNREIAVTSHQIEKARAKWKEADIIGRPVVEYEHRLAPVPKDISRAVGSFFSGDISVLNQFKLGIGVPVTTFGKIQHAKQLANNGIEAESLKKAKKESEIIFKIHQLYYGILLAREVNRLLDYSHKQTDKEIAKRERDGGDPVELLKLKIFRSDMSKRLHESEEKEILALEAMRIVLGIEPGISFDIKRARLMPRRRPLKRFDHYKRLAFKNRNDVKLLQIGLASAKTNYSLEKRRYAPDLGVGAFFEIGRAPGVTGVTTTDDFSDPFNFTRAGFGLRLKGKFDLGTRSAKIRQAKADMMKIETQSQLGLDGIQLEVKKAFLGVKSAQQELNRAEEASKLARQVLFLTQSNFDIGLAEPKDLIDAISKFLLTRGDYFKAVFDYNVAFAELDQKVDQRRDVNG